MQEACGFHGKARGHIESTSHSRAFDKYGFASELVRQGGCRIHGVPEKVARGCPSGEFIVLLTEVIHIHNIGLFALKGEGRQVSRFR